jgi:hypothetical protein
MRSLFARSWQLLQGVSVSWEVSWVIIGSNWLSQQLKHPLPTASRVTLQKGSDVLRPLKTSKESLPTRLLQPSALQLSRARPKPSKADGKQLFVSVCVCVCAE